MITEIPQLITCKVSMKTEIPCDRAAPRVRAPRARPHTTLAHHSGQRHWAAAGLSRPPSRVRRYGGCPSRVRRFGACRVLARLSVPARDGRDLVGPAMHV